MFIIDLRYTAPVEEVDRHLEAHVDWLRQGMADGWLVAAGRKVPREGGVLIARGERDAIAAKAATDPFVTEGVAQISLTEVALGLVAPEMEFLKP
jgi:uncharacterized protein YciI